MTGYIHSIQSLGTVDGPGVRSVIFASGCPLRCVYCHNPDTWNMKDGEATDARSLAERIKRFKPYIKDGGVTFSGGEPLLQAEFFCEVAEELKKEGLHIALDTSGAVMNEGVKKLLSLCDLVLLDIKFTRKEDYRKYTGSRLENVLAFLDYCEEKEIPVWTRTVIAPDINDSEQFIKELAELTKGKKCIEKKELLPFRKLCLEKYENLGIPFALRDTPEMSEERLEFLRTYM